MKRNMKLIYHSFCLIFLIQVWGGKVFSQQLETVQFSTPKTLYFSGEKIWLEAKVRLGSDASPSQLVYAELVDDQSRSRAYVMLPLEQGKVTNYLTIPDNLPSANYLLRVYTRTSPYLSLDKGIAQQFVTVINPMVPPAPSKNTSEARRILPKAEAQIQTADQLQAILKNSSSGAQAVGVSIANPFLTGEQEQIPSSIYKELDSKPLLPELFGHILEVKVPEPDTSKTYFISVHGKQSSLYTAHPNAQGSMFVDIGGLKHWDKVILQLEDGSEMPGIEIIPPVVQTKFRADFAFPELSLTEEDLGFLETWLKASRIETYFTERYSTDSVQIVTGFVADYTYLLDDYTRFETVETVLKEYVPSVAVRSRDKKKEFRLIDMAKNMVFESNPLILVDAMPVFDSNLLAIFNPKQFQKLEILNREFYLNDRTYPGVLSFSSYLNNFGLFPLADQARFFDYLGQRPAVELKRDQFVRKISEAHVPDWRGVLWWNNSSSDLDQLEKPALPGVYVLWKRVEDTSGKSKVVASYFQLD